ncbi:MAG TPA: response regulator [Candidatus Dormibacteraeota bacterium]|nr:response regulator [Candidatus Dormibacteraeota bacterium]
MRLLIADDNASLRKQLKRYFEMRGHQVETARDGVEAWHQLRRHEPDVVLCDVVLPHMTGHELARTVRRNPATENIPVVLFGSHPESAELTTGRDYADEILAKPLDLDILEVRLVSMLKRIAEGREPTPQIQGQVTAVTSAKGGTGVSTITANLALALAMHPDRSVVAVDLDLEYGDLPMLLDVPPRGGTDQLIRSLVVDGDDCAPEDFFARHDSGLRILGAPRNPVDGLHIDESGVNHLLARMRALHDHVVVDVPPGFGDPALTTLTAAQRIVVVVVPEVTALRRTLILFDILRSLDVEEERLLLVYNKTVASDQLTRERVEAFLGHRIPLEITHDLGIFHRATTTGRPVVQLDPHHPASRDLARLAELVGTPY